MAMPTPVTVATARHSPGMATMSPRGTTPMCLPHSTSCTPTAPWGPDSATTSTAVRQCNAPQALPHKPHRRRHVPRPPHTNAAMPCHHTAPPLPTTSKSPSRPCVALLTNRHSPVRPSLVCPSLRPPPLPQLGMSQVVPLSTLRMLHAHKSHHIPPLTLTTDTCPQVLACHPHHAAPPPRLATPTHLQPHIAHPSSPPCMVHWALRGGRE